MTIEVYTYNRILSELGPHIQLVAVSKTRPAADIRVLYDMGQRDFGENYVQELTEKQQLLPADIRWHFIGHLQSNKVKQIISFVHLIHGVDSLRLLKEIDRQASARGRVVDVLLQVHIAREETKFGLDPAELADLMQVVRAVGAGNNDGAGHDKDTGSIPAGTFAHVRVRGLMGMASFTNDHMAVRAEFRELKKLFEQYFSSENPDLPDHGAISSNIGRALARPQPGMASGEGGDAPILSMGMSADYQIAIEEGTNMVRIGSLLFGKRD
jgi:PLP dependent protein